MAKYRRAKSLDKLVEQINELFPNRDKRSDGWIGDAAHKSRASDHNAWVKDSKGVGVVTAQDIDKDLSQTIKVDDVVRSLFASGDIRIKYMISNGKITTRSSGGRIKFWTGYTGKNAHREHFHLSVKSDVKYFDDESDWLLDFGVTPIIQNPPLESRELLYRDPMMSGSDVKELQARLIVLKYLKKGQDDGVFGKLTNAAVRRFQLDNRLKIDGRVGPKTRAELS